MLFSNNKEISKKEVQLIKVLEKLIGRDRKYCQKKLIDKGFIFLDSWDNKMGFVKESRNQYFILSLRFKEKNCAFYQVISKKAGASWSEGLIIDYKSVREKELLESNYFKK